MTADEVRGIIDEQLPMRLYELNRLLHLRFTVEVALDQPGTVAIEATDGTDRKVCQHLPLDRAMAGDVVDIMDQLALSFILMAQKRSGCRKDEGSGETNKPGYVRRGAYVIVKVML